MKFHRFVAIAIALVALVASVSLLPAKADLCLTSGTYTPTITMLLNLDEPGSVSEEDCIYSRVGSSVSVACFFSTVDPSTASTPTSFFVSLPVPSAFTSAEDCAGVGTSSVATTTETAQIVADPTYNVCLVKFSSVGTSARPMSLNFAYTVK